MDPLQKFQEVIKVALAKFTQIFGYVFFGPNDFITAIFSTLRQFTPPNSEIICGQNVGTKVVCGMIIFL